ncbi:MAG: hypothetical protein ACPGJV_03155 [Bacteriovoracaceae bacterium]
MKSELKRMKLVIKDMLQKLPGGGIGPGPRPGPHPIPSLYLTQVNVISITIAT